MSIQVTEDTPPDMLAGSMDLKVILPNGQSVKMSVQRGTPMMDLLVQVTTAHCLSPGDYSLQPIGDKGILPFKPSTPIGALDAFTVKIVEKKLNSRGRAPQVPQSFLNTFRLQVHLPRSQLFVLRVTPDITLSEIMTHICTEKNLNIDKYEFRNPGNFDEVLELDKTLGYYKLQELSMMSKGNRTVTGLMSSADIINVKSSKHRQNSVCDSSLSSGSFGSRSGSPIPAINVVMPPQPPIRKKRRPAPKPPTFTENEKKDQTNGSVLISHSRESSDSSGYHEASVLSESPTHGSPAGRLDGDSPPDTLPRRSKLPPSQSFTNLTSIQPALKPRLTNSVSITSLNSTGHSRKKRAPPPPLTVIPKEEKFKSSTLPTSATEERRNCSTFKGQNTLRHYNPVEVSDTKVQIPVESTSEVVNETKASRDEVPASLDVDVRVPPKPKPRTFLPKTPTKCSVQAVEELAQAKDSLLETDPNFENLAKEQIEKKDGGKLLPSVETEESSASLVGKKPRGGGSEAVKKCLLVGNSEMCENPLREEAQDQADHDSIDWEYQLPPPPTDFRDSNSPNFTEFGTISITPEVFENSDFSKKKPEENCRQVQEKETFSQTHNESSQNAQMDKGVDKKFSQNKTEVMNELTNILNGSKKSKEKSLSVSNLYIESNPKDYKKNALNYSRSFSVDPVSSLDNFKLTTYQASLNNKLSTSGSHDSDIKYKNYKNLEKSSSMECINRRSNLIEKSEDVFRKPVAPVQKKLKVAKRSASSVGTAHKRNPSEVAQSDWPDDENINMLREQFLEFLKEKKLKNDLNIKSLDVIRNIIPELKIEKQKKVVEAGVKTPESIAKRDSPKKSQEVTKRYSYQGPPSINFATWGERPKTTKIVIKDEDYVTQDKIAAKKETKVEEVTKPKEMKKPAQIVIKKPGVLSRYEMFSALPRRKEISSLELVQMEDEEKKKSKEPNRVPVVCGVELKKDVKPPVTVPDFPIQERPKHSVSVYVNGSEDIHGEKASFAPSHTFILPKRNSTVMPVVKGFRPFEEKTSRVSSFPSSHININISNRAEVTSPKKQMNGAVPPPPPNISLVRLRPVSSGIVKQTPISADPRSQLLDEIRNFGGLRKLKKSGFH